MTRHLPIAYPPMQCDDGCGECCSVVAVTDDEYTRIARFVKARGIVPVRQGGQCPLYIEGRCAVYAVRPAICRAFGHSPRLE